MLSRMLRSRSGGAGAERKQVVGLASKNFPLTHDLTTLIFLAILPCKVHFRKLMAFRIFTSALKGATSPQLRLATHQSTWRRYATAAAVPTFSVPEKTGHDILVLMILFQDPALCRI